MPIVPQDLIRRTLLTDFYALTSRVFLHLHPGQMMKHGWHIKAMCHSMSEVDNGVLDRLLITVPPRHLKSITVSVAFPAWLLGRNPTLRIMVASYGDDLAKKLGQDCRSVMESEWYQDLFPGTQLQKLVPDDLQTTKGGVRKAVSLGGAATGFGADLIIIDDLMKAADANSPNERQRVKDYYSQTLYSRLNDKEHGRIIAIQQRLHEDDLAAFLIASDFHHLNLPAVAESNERIAIGPDQWHQRRTGDVLFPERESKEVLSQIRRDIGDYAYSAQYQQTPVPRGGNQFRWEWVQTYCYEDRPERGELLCVVQSWDTALSEESGADFSVCTTWGLRKDAKWILLEVDRKRLAYPNLQDRIISNAKSWKADHVLIELAGAGISVMQALRSLQRNSDQRTRSFHLEGVTPKGDKENRFLVQTIKIRDGEVLFPDDAPWQPIFRQELLAFPAGRHDDQVDSVSQFLYWFQSRRGGAYVAEAQNNGVTPRPSGRMARLGR